MGHGYNSMQITTYMYISSIIRLLYIKLTFWLESRIWSQNNYVWLRLRFI